jgi:hypothetical protein
MNWFPDKTFGNDGKRGTLEMEERGFSKFG